MPVKLKGHVRPGDADRRYYMIRVQVDGRRVVVSSNSNDKAIALRKESMVINALRANISIPQEDIVALVTGSNTARHKAAIRHSGGMTLKEAFDKCLKSPTIWRNIKAISLYTKNCEVIEGILGADTPIASLSHTDIERLTLTLVEKQKPGKDNAGKTLSGATVNNHLACLRRMFNVALEQHWDNMPTGFPKVPSVKKRKGREYFMSPQHEKEIFEAVLKMDEDRPGPVGGHPRKRDAHRYHLLFTVLVESGLRLSEALGLLDGELVMPRGKDTGMIELFRTDDLKTGRARSVPMTATCRKAFEACRGVPDGPFKDLNDRRAQDIWDRAKKAAKIKHRDCVIHSLRHTCASRLLESGADIKLVKEWLGHTNIATTDIYAHLQTKQLTGAANMLHLLRQTAAAEA